MDGCKDVIFSTSGRAIVGRPLSMRKVVARTRDASITSLLPSASGIANQSIYNVTRVRHSRLTRRYLGQLPPPRLASNSLVYNFFRHDRDRVTKAPCFRGVVCTCLPSTSPKLHSPFPPLLCNPRQHFQSVFSPRERQGKLTQGRGRGRERVGISRVHTDRVVPREGATRTRPLLVNRVVFKHIRVTLHIYWRFVAAWIFIAAIYRTFEIFTS